MKPHIYLDKDIESKIKAFKKSGKPFNLSLICRNAILKYISEHTEFKLPEKVQRDAKEILQELYRYIDAMDNMEKTKTSVGEEKIITKNEIKDPDIKDLSI